jgi:hypothetical protein
MTAKPPQKKTRTKRRDVAPAYELTKQERAAMERFHSRRASAPPAPSIKLSINNGVAKISVNHDDELIGSAMQFDALATVDTDFYDGILNQMVNIGTHGQEVDEKAVNFVLSVVKGIEPRDQLETMLGVQMAAVHNATMTFARRLNHVDNIQKQDSAERALNKLARTFTMQLDALKRYRREADQTVRVERVIVNDGGQAVVGNVTQGAGGEDQK